MWDEDSSFKEMNWNYNLPSDEIDQDVTLATHPLRYTPITLQTSET